MMEEQGRILALDIGDVRIGVAVTDLLRITAQPRETVKCVSLKADLEAIRRIVEEAEAVLVVAGLPLDQNGEPGKQAKKTLKFVEHLREILDIEVVTQDERYTTAMMERMLIEHNVRRKGRKKVIDKLAAQNILQTYLDRVASQKRREQP